MASRPLAVYTDYDEIDVAPGISLLEEHGWEVRTLNTRDADEIAAQAAGATALMVGYATVDRALIDRLPSVRILALLSMGFDNVDVEYATQRGIWVSNVPGVATREVAEHALALALAGSRQLMPFNAEARAGRWALDAAPLPRNLSTLTLSVLGYGRIGRELARIAAPVFGRVLAHDPFVTELEARDAALGIQLVSLDEAFARGDMVSLHLPLTSSTERLLNRERLAAMPAGAFVINVSRGQLIDESALLEALESGHIAGAGLDVLTEEPPALAHPLLQHKRVIATPHIGFLSERTIVEYPLTQARNAIALVERGEPLDPINAPIPATA